MLLHIRAVGATDVPKMDYFGKSDPYLVIKNSASNRVWRTEVIKETYDPIWNQEFHISITSKNTDVITMELYDYDMLKSDDLISTYSFKVEDFPIGQIIDKWYDFTPANGVEKGGKVRLIFHYDDYDAKPFNEDKKSDSPQ